MTLEKFVLNRKRKLYDKEVIIYDETSDEKIWHDSIIVFNKGKEYYGFATKQEREDNEWLLRKYGKREIDDFDTDCEYGQVFIYLS